MDEYNKELEKNLLEMMAQKEKADRKLLALEIFIGATVSVVLVALVMIASFVPMESWMRILLIVIGFVPFVVGCAFALWIEQVAGYYECAKCGYRYVPTYGSVLMAAHMGRTRYMKCPKCHRKSWQKKRLEKQ